jgi:hypothetical protein
VLPTPVFTSPSSTVVALFPAEAPGVAQSGSPIGAMVIEYYQVNVMNQNRIDCQVQRSQPCNGTALVLVASD